MSYENKFQMPNKSQEPILNDRNNVSNLEFASNPPIPPFLKGGERGLSIFIVREWPIGHE
jgi:hypothetical protein